MTALSSSILILLFLAATAASGWMPPLLCALIIGTIYFSSVLAKIYSEIPNLNLIKFIGASTGLFYFGGGTLAIASQLLLGDNPYIRLYAYWRNYDPLPMCAATVLAFSCSLLAILASDFVKFHNLGSLAPRKDADADPLQSYRERMVAAVMCAAVGALCAGLLVTGKMTVSGGSINNIVRAAGSEWTVIATTAAPACVLLLMGGLLNKNAGSFYKLTAIVSSLPIGLAIFTLGRRYIIASLAISVIGLIVYRGIRLKPGHLVAIACVALLAFFTLSRPFLALRAAQSEHRSVGVTELFTEGASQSRLAGTPRMTVADMAAAAAARSDLMGELAQMTSRTPLSRLHWGTGFLSQFATVVPHNMWSGKQRFLATEMYNDNTVCADAGLPPQDLAGSLVLYSFGEVGWAAPILYCFALFLFVFIVEWMAQLFGSQTFTRMAVSTLIVYGIVADNGWGAEILQELRFLAIAGTIIFLAKAYISPPRRMWTVSPIPVAHNN